MDENYEIWPNVVSQGKRAEMTIHGLHAKTLRPGEKYNVHIASMCNHTDVMTLEIVALPPENIPLYCEAREGGRLEFQHTFTTVGEYSIFVSQPQNEEKKRVTIQRIYAVPPELARYKPYKGDLHIHTYYSDGRMSPIYMAVMAKKLGLDFAAITDHGKYAPSIEAIEKARQINLNLLLLPGEEVAVPSAHIVSINANKCITDLKGDDAMYQQQIREILETDLKNTRMVENLTKEQYAPTKWAVKNIHAYGGYAFLAHPYWISGNRYDLNLPIGEQLLQDGDIDGVEIIGGYTPTEFESNLLATAKYYSDLAQGRYIPVVGNSDTHSRPTNDIYGWYWTTVFAESLTADKILEAILDCRSVACEHPNGGHFRAYGPFDLVEYVCFLEREFFPLHDRISAMEGELYFDILRGRAVSQEQLTLLKQHLAELYNTSEVKLGN
ncbi:PHP domain-containing protein [Candidatus Poribacteria bacterium]|nr:PHP domain-containing protein [Candidatus Poribacteria bacterium]